MSFIIQLNHRIVYRRFNRFGFIYVTLLFLTFPQCIWGHTPEEKAFYLQSRIVLQLTPSDAIAGNAVGVWNLEYNDLEASHKAFEQVARYHPGNFLASAGLALNYEQKASYKIALEMLETGKDLPEDFLPFVHLLKGRLLFHTNKLAEAKGELLQGLRKAENPHGHYLWLGRIAEVSGDIEQAIKSYQSAIKADPFWLEPYSRLSLIYSRQGKKEQAKEALRSIVTLDNPSPYPNNDIQTLWRAAMAGD